MTRAGKRAALSICVAVMAVLVGEASGETVKSLKAFHRSGQTFLTWSAVETYGPFTPQTGVEAKDPTARTAERKKADKETTGVRYEVYRSAEPITDEASLAKAEKVGTAAPLSIYYAGRTKSHWRDPKLVPAVCIEDRKPLLNGTELFVHSVEADAKPGRVHYAVLVSRGGALDKTITKDNALQKPVDEKPGEPEPVLQKVNAITAKQHYMYQNGPAKIHYYLRWVHKPYSNVPRVFIWAVVVPGKYDPKTPAALQVTVHGWGSSQDGGTYWYGVPPACIRLSSMNHPCQDWWYGYHEDYGVRRLRPDGVIFNYTERRLMSMVKWVQTKWAINPNAVLIEGQSMGGTGAIHVGGKRGETFAYVNSWVGIACWPDNGWFRTGETHRWGKRYQYKTYNGERFDDWVDMAWWLRKFPEKETPFFSFANGKNDGQIGWPQAVKFVKALQETKRAFVFVWGMSGHGQRAIFMFDPKTMALDQSLPAFNNCSLDSDVGTAKKLAKPQDYKLRGGRVLKDAFDGSSTGQINAHLRWRDALDEEDKYELTVFLAARAPKDACTVDITPRRCQKFKPKPGEVFKWTNTSAADKKQVQSGAVTADQWGLVTVKKVTVTKGKNRIAIRKP